MALIEVFVVRTQDVDSDFGKAVKKLACQP